MQLFHNGEIPKLIANLSKNTQYKAVYMCLSINMICTCMNITIILKKKRHEYERKCEGHRRSWWGRRRGKAPAAAPAFGGSELRWNTKLDESQKAAISSLVASL